MDTKNNKGKFLRKNKKGELLEVIDATKNFKVLKDIPSEKDRLEIKKVAVKNKFFNDDKLIKELSKFLKSK